jgi:hypothetical protein
LFERSIAVKNYYRNKNLIKKEYAIIIYKEYVKNILVEQLLILNNQK